MPKAGGGQYALPGGSTDSDDATDYSSGWDDIPVLAPEHEFMSVCWYGAEGTRKTTYLSHMANLGPILIVNAEAGAKSRALARRGVDVDNIRIWPAPGQKLTFGGLENLYFTVKSRLDNESGSVAGVGFDSITEIVRVLLANERERGYLATMGSSRARDRWQTDRNDYGVLANQISTILRWFRDLPCHFAMTALERRDQDDDGKVKYGPAVTPALMQDIPGFVDTMAHTTILENGTGVGWTQPIGKYRAKDRDGILPNPMPDPTFTRIRAYIDGNLTEDTDQILIDAKEAAKAA